MKDLIKKILRESVVDDKIVCDNCGWSWLISDGGDDLYNCHKCGHDNTPKKQSNLNKILEPYKVLFPEPIRHKVDEIEKFVVNFIKERNFNVKFLNSCSTGFAGVRTKNQIIICSPDAIKSLGDILYTIFHEIRHEIQMNKTMMNIANPLSDYDLDDFESLSKKYWELELDADRFAKEMVAKIIIEFEIPIDFAKQVFRLSPYIENYPSASKMILNQVRMLVNDIKQMKKSGVVYQDIQDHPIVKRHLDKLEDFI